VPKPTEQIMAWIGTLTPPDELAVRMALSETNPWCREDKPWQIRVTELQSELIKSNEDRRRYEEQAAKIARDMEGAVQEMKDRRSGRRAQHPDLTRYTCRVLFLGTRIPDLAAGAHSLAWAELGIAPALRLMQRHARLPFAHLATCADPLDLVFGPLGFDRLFHGSLRLPSP
jgi:hypothetical protein